jgi:hypothetical protein
MFIASINLLCRFLLHRFEQPGRQVALTLVLHLCMLTPDTPCMDCLGSQKGRPEPPREPQVQRLGALFSELQVKVSQQCLKCPTPRPFATFGCLCFLLHTHDADVSPCMKDCMNKLVICVSKTVLGGLSAGTVQECTMVTHKQTRLLLHPKAINDSVHLIQR